MRACACARLVSQQVVDHAAEPVHLAHDRYLTRQQPAPPYRWHVRAHDMVLSANSSLHNHT